LRKSARAKTPKEDAEVDESKMTHEQKTAKRNRKIKEEADRRERESAKRREKMVEASDPPIENDENYTLDKDWLHKFIETNAPQIEAGQASIRKLGAGGADADGII